MGKTYIADKETLDKCYAILSADGIYGFIEHMDVLSPTARIEYIGQNKDFTPISLNKDTGTMTLNSWADFPIIVANKPWMVRADGTPDYRLDENDYTKKEDGTGSDVSNTSYNGGAFSWLAKIYKQEYMLGNDRVVKFSMRERDGFEPVGFKDPNNNVLEGVWIPMFYGSILGADTSTPKMVSLAGLQPCYNNTTDKEHTAIANFSSRAAFLGGGIVQTITDLLIMFAKSTNSQEAYGYGNSSGYDASLAPTNGVKQNAVVGGGQFYGTKDAKSLKCSTKQPRAWKPTPTGSAIAGKSLYRNTRCWNPLSRSIPTRRLMITPHSLSRRDCYNESINRQSEKTLCRRQADKGTDRGQSGEGNY